MNTIQKTSVLICVAILVVFLGIGTVIKWSQISDWLGLGKEGRAPVELGADPFHYDPLVPSYIKDLHPVYTIKADLRVNEAAIAGQAVIEFDNPKTKDLNLYIYDYSWSPMRVKSIRYDEKSVPFSREGSVLRLANVFGQKARGSLTVEFESPVPRSGTRYGVKDDIWTLTNWYPMLGALDQRNQWYVPSQPIAYGDPFIYHYGDYDVTFVAPEAYQWVTTWGLGHAQPLQDGRKSVRYKAKKVLNFSMVGSPLYRVESVEVTPNMTVHIASPSQQNIQMIKTIAEAAFKAYIEEYGDLPYPEVAIAETGPYTNYAMEYANMAIFSKDMYHNNLVDHWLPHEIAHLWWYNSISTIEPMNGWLDEGLVEASVYFYNLKRHGSGSAEALLQEYIEDERKLRTRYPYGKLGKRLSQFDTRDEFDWTWYSKGALLYHNLRKNIGDAKFSEFMNRVQRNYHGYTLGPEHLDQALGQTLRGQVQYFVPNIERINREGFTPLKIESYVDTIVNDMAFYPTVSARVKGKTVYVPVREIMQKLGYRVTWNEQKQATELNAAAKNVLIKENSATVEMNGKKFELGKPALEIKDRIMVPSEFFDKVMGYQVRYDSDARVIHIKVSERQ
ncbi:stalk domain-containing protein [Brevibacillus sp. SYSU BS000544]|uniref:stalk domain-containing protein n=1 Tax=Brevibacillus sp. SYSU BS000544 TaxID=3416443 RepID=UPI003CE45B4C